MVNNLLLYRANYAIKPSQVFIEAVVKPPTLAIEALAKPFIVLTEGDGGIAGVGTSDSTMKPYFADVIILTWI